MACRSLATGCWRVQDHQTTPRAGSSIDGRQNVVEDSTNRPHFHNHPPTRTRTRVHDVGRRASDYVGRFNEWSSECCFLSLHERMGRSDWRWAVSGGDSGEGARLHEQGTGEFVDKT